VVVRPERVRVEAPRKTGENRLPGKVERVVYAGAISQLVITLDRGASIRCMLANDGAGSSFDRGTRVSVYLPCEALRVLRTEAAMGQEQDRESSAAPARAMAD
jgi:ABC-type Fe3+/spermidine/putrescine transport system ATPase subunit